MNFPINPPFRSKKEQVNQTYYSQHLHIPKIQDVVLTFYTPLFLDGLGAVYSSQRSITTDRSKLGR